MHYSMRNGANLLGFALVELSIVIIIIGLLIAGISAGSSLVKNSQRSIVIREVTEYKAALLEFKSIYKQLPGDFNQASAYWPSCDPTPVNCDGDNDGQINSIEAYRFWQHLALAGLIQGNFTGVDNGAGQDDANTPKSIFGNRAHYYVGYWNPFQTPFDNYFFLGKLEGGVANVALFTPSEAQSIDTKVDDGKPTQGRIKGGAAINPNGNCINPPDNPWTDAIYEASNQGVACYMFIQFD